MQPARKHSAQRHPAHLLRIITSEFDEPSRNRACELLDEFLDLKFYSKAFALTLIEIIRGRDGDAWAVRRLAALMLEHQILKIPAEGIAEFDFLLVQLHLKSAFGKEVTVRNSVLKEGYSTTDTRGFITEFRRRLARLNRVHDQIKGSRRSRSALVEFIRTTRRDAKLTVARYLFKPDEVADEILKQVRMTNGIVDINELQFACVDREAERTFDAMPEFEARIIERLRESSRIYWVTDETSSEINSLVEYPLTTVVLVIKLPGSSIEIEIKRAGRRGKHPLSAVHSRDGYAVPPSHRFDGGSTQWMLRYEINMASKIAGLYRLVHGTEAPVSRFISRSSIFNVPVDGDQQSILNYFSDEHIFGEGFYEMRAAMKEVVDSFDAENKSHTGDIPGDFGLTMRFLTHIRPTQTVFAGTSSFRLDKLAAYLSSDGPEVYFTKGLEVEYSNEDARRFADEILEEVLCVYQPPDVRHRSYRQYVDAALTENRVQADNNFLSAMQQTGRFYGTMLAVRAHSMGESFVPRNVGLKSVWEDGEWKIKIIFMDHDNLSIIYNDTQNFHPQGAYVGTALDELFVWGEWDGQKTQVGIVDSLEMIYGVSNKVLQEGKEQLFKAMESAYRKTHREMKANPQFQQFFHKSFIERINDWDRIASEYLKVKNDSIDFEAWKEKMLNRFVQAGREKNVIVEHLMALEKYAMFLERYSFLFDSDLN